MQPTYEDLDVLLEIQKIDLAVMQAKKARAELPQRIQVMKVRKKRSEVEPKIDQVLELRRACEAKITEAEDEDRSLAEKQERSQEEIDKSSADYRKVESHSKEMAGLVKRRVTLEERLNELRAELDKIVSAQSQLDSAVAALDAEEARLRSSFQEQDAELVDKVKSLLAQRSELASNIPDELLKRYERVADKAAGVAIGKLEDSTCGVCRTAIGGGHLIDLRSQAPLGVCPNCKRLLVIE